MTLRHAVRWYRGLDHAGPYLVRYGRPEEAPPIVEDGGITWEPARVMEREVLYRPRPWPTPLESVTTPEEVDRG
jgi:hypothetical protein